MTDADLLARAARALREAHTGERAGSGFTRARVMNALHRERRRRILRWAVVSPLASVLLVGSAWAQSTGQWPVLWNAVASVFIAAPEAPAASRAPSSPRGGEPRDAREVPDEAPALDAGDAPPVAPAPPERVERAERERPPERVRRATRARRSRRAEPSSARAPQAPATPSREAPPDPVPERDRELSRFRAAHDLHFQGRAQDAISAYADYLREFPDGRFVPEARYATALDQIKLGNRAAAREALAPFAAGRFGGYRQKEARELLEALEAARGR